MLVAKTHFYDGIIIDDLGIISCVLNHLYGRCVVVPFDIFFDEGTMWIGHRSVISFILHESVFLYFYHHGDFFTTDV